MPGVNPQAVELALSIGAVGAATLLIAAWVGHRSGVLLPVLAAYGAHVLVAVVLYGLRGIGDKDARLYDTAANQLMAYWTGEATNHPNFTVGKEGWPVLLAGMYRVTTNSPVLGLLVNACACGLLVAVLAATARRLELPVRRTAWMVTLLPPVLFWGSQLLREPLAWLLTACVAYAVAGLTKRDSLPDWATFVLSVGALLWVRGSLAVIAAGAGVLAILIARRASSAFIVGGTVGLVALAGPLTARLEAVTGGLTIEQINQNQEALSRTADTSGFAVAEYGSFTDLVLGLPLLLPRSLLGPYPWEWPSLNPLFALDAVIWLLLLFYAWRGWRRSTDRRRLLSLVIPAAALVAALAISSGNYGTLQRLRLQAAVLLVPVAAAGIGRPDQEVDKAPSAALTAGPA